MDNDKPKSFIVHQDYEQHMVLLSDAEVGRIFRALFAHNAKRKLPELSKSASIAFSFIRAQKERDDAKYTKKCATNRENGARGGRPKAEEKTEQNPTKPKKTERLFEKPNKTLNDNDNKNNKEKDILTDIQKESEWNDFVEMRKQIKKPLTKRAITLALNKLEELAPGDIPTQKRILDQSVFYNWQGIFALQEGRHGRSNDKDTGYDATGNTTGSDKWNLDIPRL